MQAGTDVLINDMGGHFVVLLPVNIHDEAAAENGGVVSECIITTSNLSFPILPFVCLTSLTH